MRVSHTPTDEPDSKPDPRYTPDMTRQVEPSPTSSQSRASSPRGIVDRVRTLVDRARRWLGGERSSATDDAPTFADSSMPPPDCPTVGKLPPREFPLSYPTRSYQSIDNDVDLLVHCDEETLTLVHPEDPQTRIESDTWVPIER